MTSDAHNAIAKIKDEHQLVKKHLADLPSLATAVDDVFKKILLLSAASYYETKITDILIRLYENNCGGGCTLPTFVKSQALERQYFKLFEWDTRNANRLFGLFGAGFKKYMKQKVDKNRDLDESIQAFLELGRLRNKLSHNNLATYSLEKTADDVFELYERAHLFTTVFSDEICKYIKQPNTELG